MIQSIAHDLALIRQHGPLVHNITNYVAMPTVANMLLALGAAPLMAHAAEELEDLSKISQALVLNIGTLDRGLVSAMQQAQNFVHQKSIPVILDPVGAGASQYRTKAALSLLEGGVTILRGNASEIMALVDRDVVTKGVEATADSLSAQAAAEYLAKKYSCVVIISGATDVIVSQRRKCYVHKSPFSLLTKVTAMGCSVTAMVGAFAAINQDYFSAAVHAMVILGVAGEKAMQCATGPGMFYAKLLDVLHQLTKNDLEQCLTITEKKGAVVTTEIRLSSRSVKPGCFLTPKREKPQIDYSLYLVADSALCAPDLLPQLVKQAVANGATCVQFRGKALSHEQMIATGKKLLDVLRPLKIPLIINDRVMVAKQLDADGVHLGQKDTPIAVARKELGRHKIIGLSIENEEQAHRCARCDVDYFGVGPIFATTTKLDAAPPIGIKGLQVIRKILSAHPVVAIGGINVSNALSLTCSGVDGVAVVSAILSARDPDAVTKQLRNSMRTTAAPFAYHCVAAIAGSDSSGGAGVQADIKTISATGGYAASVITALTAQNTTGVSGIYEIPAEFVGAQCDSIFNDINFSAVKIGMLYSSAIIEMVANKLEKWQAKNIVLDPVILAKSGDKLVTDEAFAVLKKRLFPLAYLITPNLMEAETLLQYSVNSKQDMERAVKELAEAYHTNVLIKGGHLGGELCDDVLFCYATKKIYWFFAPRIASNNTHGTGCTFSAAIASYLAQGSSLLDAVSKAKDYLTHALEVGSHYLIGQGHGPPHHFFDMESKKR